MNYAAGAGFYFSTDRDAEDETRKKLRELARLPTTERTADQATALRRAFRETRIPEVRQRAAELAVARKRESDADKAIPTLRIMEEMAEPRRATSGSEVTTAPRVNRSPPRARELSPRPRGSTGALTDSTSPDGWWILVIR